MLYEMAHSGISDSRILRILRRGYRYRNNAHRHKGSLTVHIFVAFFVMKLSWWNPVSWANDLLGDAASVGRNVYNFVTRSVEAAVNLVENDIIDAADFAATVIEDVKSYAVQGFTDVEGYVEDIYHDLVSDINQAADFAANAITTVLHDAENLYNDAVSLADNLYNQAVRYAGDIVGDAEAAARALANDAISIAESFAKTVWNDGIKAFYDDDIVPLINDAKQALSWAGTMWKWFDTGVVDAWKIIVEAMDWLIWFAENPFTFVEKEFTAIVDWSKQAPSAFESGALADVSRIESAFNDWLGI